MNWLAILIIIGTAGISALISLMMARLGEPTSVWLWHTTLGLF